jgi:hypothetical protein
MCAINRIWDSNDDTCILIILFFSSGLLRVGSEQDDVSIVDAGLLRAAVSRVCQWQGLLQCRCRCRCRPQYCSYLL